MKTKTYSPTPAHLRRLAAALRQGELVAIPTETVYGLAANALDARACRAIFQAKGRPTRDPLIVHVLDLAQAEQLAEFNPAARRLARHFWPGPLTLVLPRKSCVPGIVTAGRPTVAIRAPAHPLARRLLRLAETPLAAPSANLFGYISPTTAAHVTAGLGGRIPHVLDGGPCTIGVESTIVEMTHPQRPRILRPGAIGIAALEAFLRVKIAQGTPTRPTKKVTGLLAPGMLPQHYSPHTSLSIKRAWKKLPAGVAGIHLRRPPGRATARAYWLSERGTLTEVARNLYRVLRLADLGGHRQIWIESLPAESGELAAAIRDRLRRAAAKH